MVWLACLLTGLLLLALPGGPAGAAQPAQSGQSPQPAQPAATDTAPSPADVDATLDKSRRQIETIQKLLQNPAHDLDLVKLRSDALDIAGTADHMATELAPVLASMQARLAELGPAPTVPGATEAPDVTQQRATLNRRREQIDAQIKLSRLLTLESNQVADQITALRRSQFQASLGERTASILARPFWSDLRHNLQRDAGGMERLGFELSGAAARTPVAVWVGIALLAALIVLLRRRLDLLVRRLIAARMPHGRLRRSCYAIFVTLSWAMVPGLIARLVYSGLIWNEPLAEATDTLMLVWINLMFFGGFVAGSGHALLCADRPTWRLAPLPDVIAVHLRWFPRLLAVVMVAIPFVEDLVTAVNATLETAVAVHCIFALLLSAIVVAAMVRGERWRRVAQLESEGDKGASPDDAAAAAIDRDDGPPARPLARPLWLLALVSVCWLALATGLVCLLIGYVALGSFLVRQVAWVQVVGWSTYLLTSFIDDLFMTVLARPAGAVVEPGAERPGAVVAVSSAASHGQHEAALPRTSREQVAVLLSALLRVVLYLVAIVVVAAPFGAGPSELLQRTSRLSDGLQLGEIRLSPLAVLQAGLVLGFGVYGVRLLQRWLMRRFLPTTRLEPGMHASVTTLLGYVGVVFALALALSALGLSLERIAWLASALSVGIGFGLQAVVQNFVSGLILLAERPVKVGDWVSLGGAEGDIKRINVRATEIQLGDRSTVIVPNSEFITKTVRNVTRSDPLGLVQIKLPMPLDTDATRVREVLLQAFADHPDVLASPGPNVFLEGVDGHGLMFSATASVASPRQVYGVRSALLFDMLERLRAQGVALGVPTQLVVRPRPRSTGREPSA